MIQCFMDFQGPYFTPYGYISYMCMLLQFSYTSTVVNALKTRVKEMYNTNSQMYNYGGDEIEGHNEERLMIYGTPVSPNK